MKVVHRIVGYLLAACVCVSCINPVFAEDNTQIYVNEQFENYVTNSEQNVFEEIGPADVIIKEYAQRQKALYVNKRNQYSMELTKNFTPAEGDMVVQFDIKVEGERFPWQATIKNAAGQGITPVSVDAEGNLSTDCGKKYAHLGIGEWTNIAVVYKPLIKRYSIYIDGKNVLDNWCVSNTNFENPSKLILNMVAVETGDSDVLIDNLRIYSGSQLAADSVFPDPEYNEESVEYEETIIEDDLSIINVRTFDSEIEGFAVYQKTNLIEWKEEEGNGYVHIEVNSPEDAFIDLTNSSGFTSIYNTVISVDFRSNSYTSLIQMVPLKLLPDNANCNVISINPGGAMCLQSGQQIASLRTGKWYNLAVAFDFLLGRFDVYLDGELIAEDIQLSVVGKGLPSTMRFYSAGGQNDLDIDNVFIYGGKEPRQILDENALSGYPLETTLTAWQIDEKAKSFLTDKVAYSANVGSVYYNGEKSYLTTDAPFITEDNIIYLPIEKTAELLGCSVNVNGNQYESNGVILQIGSDVMRVGETQTTLSGEIVLQNETAYAPVDAFSETGMFGESVFYNVEGLIVFGTDSISENKESEIERYMMFQRPSHETLAAKYEEIDAGDVHPKIFATQSDFDRAKLTIETDPTAKEWFDSLKTLYSNIENMACMTYNIADGVRLLPVCQEMYNRVLAMSFIYKMTGDTAYADRAYKELEAAANFPDWNPDHFLDVAVLSNAMAIGYDWLYDYLKPEQRAVLEQAMIEHAVKEYLKAYTMKAWWIDDLGNWSMLCNAGAITLSMALMDQYPEECSVMAEIALKGIEKCFLSFEPDGAWYEGIGYCDGTQYPAMILISTLKNSLGSDFDLTKMNGFAKSAEWVAAMCHGNGTFQFSDGAPDTMRLYAGMWMGYEYEKPAIQAARAKAIKNGVTGPDLAVYDLLFYIPDYVEDGGELNENLDAMFREVEMASMRTSHDDSALFLAFKGGNPGKYGGHSHLDSGTFEILQNGIKWAKDIGGDNYNYPGYGQTDATQHPNRWDFYALHPEGHNCIVINPQEESMAQKLNATSYIERFESSDRTAIGVMNLSEAYEHKANSVRRGFKLDDDRRSVTIRDEINIDGTNNQIYWFMHTPISDASNITIEGNHAILTDVSGKKFYLEFVTNAQDAQLSVMDETFLPTFQTPAPQMTQVPTKKLAIRLIGGGALSLTVKLYDYDLYGSLPTVENVPIDEWTLAQGERTESPHLTGIYSNGNLIENFYGDTNEYDVYCTYDEEFPEITATVGENATVDVTEVEKTDTEAEYNIKVSLQTSGGFVNNYTVRMKKVPYILETLDGYSKINPVAITASDIPEPANPPEQVNDNNFASRFAVEGDGQWIQLDYGSVVNADAYAIAYYMGTERISYYDILISEDGENYTTIFEGETSGITDYYEVFKQPLKLRYLKLVGHENSEGAWNSPTEIALLKKVEP